MSTSARLRSKRTLTLLSRRSRGDADVDIRAPSFAFYGFSFGFSVFGDSISYFLTSVEARR